MSWPQRRQYFGSSSSLLLDSKQRPLSKDLLLLQASKSHEFRSKDLEQLCVCHVCQQLILGYSSWCRNCRLTCHRKCEFQVTVPCVSEGDDYLRQIANGFDHLHASTSRSTQNGAGSGFLASTNNNCRTLFLRPNNNANYASSAHRIMAINGMAKISEDYIDVMYITERMLVLSFPSSGQEASYRQQLKDVSRMLKVKHGNKYKIFNLSKRRHDIVKLNVNVAEFGWPEELAPPLERLCTICKEVENWMASDAGNVVVLHSKGGKCRPGVVVAAYMHYTNICASDDQALDRFAMRRFYDEHVEHVAQPSQRRYVIYFSGLLSGAIKVNSNAIFLQNILLLGLPQIDGKVCHPFVKVYEKMTPIYTSSVYCPTSQDVEIQLESPLQLRGDILVMAYHKKSFTTGREVLFRCQFNSCAMPIDAKGTKLVLAKHELDGACFDERFEPNSRVEFLFTLKPTPAQSSGAEIPLALRSSEQNESATTTTLLRCDSYEDFETTPEDEDRPPQQTLLEYTEGPVDGSLYATVKTTAANSNHHIISNEPSPPPLSSPLQKPTTPSNSSLLSAEPAACVASDSVSSTPLTSEPPPAPIQGTGSSNENNRFRELPIAQRTSPERQDSNPIPPPRLSQKTVPPNFLELDDQQLQQSQQPQQQQIQGLTNNNNDDSAFGSATSGATTATTEDSPSSNSSVTQLTIAAASNPWSTESVVSNSTTASQSGITKDYVTEATMPSEIHALSNHVSYADQNHVGERRQSYPKTPPKTPPKPARTPVEFEHRPPPVLPPSKRPVTPGEGPLRPVTPAADAPTTVDVNLVGQDRYDPQSKAFSYVPAQALQAHFKSPKKQTKLVPQFDDLSSPAAASAVPYNNSTSAPSGLEFGAYPFDQHQVIDSLSTPLSESTSFSAASSQTSEQNGSLADEGVELPIIEDSPRRAIVTTYNGGVGGDGGKRNSAGEPPPANHRSLPATEPSISSVKFDMDELLDPNFYLNFSSQQQPKQRPDTNHNAYNNHIDSAPTAFSQQQHQLHPEENYYGTASFRDKPDTAPVALCSSFLDQTQSQSGNTVTARTDEDFQRFLDSLDLRPVEQQRFKYDRLFNDAITGLDGSSAPGVIVDQRSVSALAAPYRPTPSVEQVVQSYPSHTDTVHSYVYSKGPMPAVNGEAEAMSDWSLTGSKYATSTPYGSSRSVGSTPVLRNWIDDTSGDNNNMFSMQNRSYNRGRHDSAAFSDMDPDEWLDAQLDRLKIKKDTNDTDLQRRRIQEKLLLDELRHIHVERQAARGRNEADYSVEGVGTKMVDPYAPEELIKPKPSLEHALSQPWSAADLPLSLEPSSITAADLAPPPAEVARQNSAKPPSLHRLSPIDASVVASSNGSSHYHVPRRTLERRSPVDAWMEQRQTTATPIYEIGGFQRRNVGGINGTAPARMDYGEPRRPVSTPPKIDSYELRRGANTPATFDYLETLLYDVTVPSKSPGTTTTPVARESPKLQRFHRDVQPSPLSVQQSPKSILKKPKDDRATPQQYYASQADLVPSASVVSNGSLYSPPHVAAAVRSENTTPNLSYRPQSATPAKQFMPWPVPQQQQQQQQHYGGYRNGTSVDETPPVVEYGTNRSQTPAFPKRGETPIPYHPLLYSASDSRSPHPHLQRYQSGSRGAGFESQSRSPSPTSNYYGHSRRSSLVSVGEPLEVMHHHPVFVKDTSKYWYKPTICREDAINALKDRPPGSFIIRDSNSFPGAFGLALKVATPPPGVQAKAGDGTELVRHFLIEPTAKGVKLKGCSNEPVFGSLSALVYQHSITPLALPCKLLLPESDPTSPNEQMTSATQLLEQGAACNVIYIHSCDTESLTGPEAVRRAVDRALHLLTQRQLSPTSVHFKVSSQGITVTDNTRKLFFRRHYPVNSVTFCGLDPEDRRWSLNGSNGYPAMRARIYGFVARKIASRTENTCHIFAELEPEQPATAIVNFITKVMMASPPMNGTIAKNSH